MKQLWLCLSEYHFDCEQFPPTLDDLVAEEIILKDDLDSYRFIVSSDPNSKLVYIAGYDQDFPSTSIIMYTPYEINGERACLQIDGDVKILKEQEFIARMSQQRVSLNRK